MSNPEKQAMAILFADIGGSTSLYEEVGDTEAHLLISNCLLDMEQTINKHHGNLLRTVGDAALANFTNCDLAYAAAIEIQERHINSRLSVRIGFHFGDAIPDKGDVYGNAVNIAARVASLANLDEITTTESSVLLLSAHLRNNTVLLGLINVKGISDPVPIYRILWRKEDESVTAIQTAVSLSIHHPQNIQLKLTFNNTSLLMNRHLPLISIGRTDENDITINHHCASRHHATITLSQGQFTLVDQSTNGTYLIKEQQSAVFIRRESITLDAHGIIGTGWLPNSSDADLIRFEYMAQSD